MFDRLERVYRNAERICVDARSKIVFMSDCHRGVGNRADNFLPNENLFLAALQYYYHKGFWYMELGDGDELWENRDYGRIVEMHEEVFKMLSVYESEGRLTVLYGNHDCQKKGKKNIKAGMVLVDGASGQEIFVVHGHQGDWLNDIFWRLARFLVRYVWKPLEMLGVSDPTSAAHNYKQCKKAERRLEAFAEKKKILVLAGHTHRPSLPVPGKGRYLNDGSCVHPGSITAMELENGRLTLVKWIVSVRENRTLAVKREILAGPYPLWHMSETPYFSP